MLHRRLRALALLLLAIPCVAQTVTLTNYSGGAFEGFLRCNVDRAPPATAGRIGDAWFVMGAATGAETHAVDVWCRLANGETRGLDLATAEPMAYSPRPLPGADHFGGPATLDGAPLEWLSLEPDGAAWLAHLHGRSGPMLHLDLWLTWYPTQPGWCTGEALVTASNGSVPDLFATVGAGGLTMAFGDSVVVVPGRGIGSLVEPGTTFAEGQARGLPLTFLWPRHLRRASDWSSAGAAIRVAAVGVERVAPWGNPTQLVNGRRWAASKLPGAVAALHSWSPRSVASVRRARTAGAWRGKRSTCRLTCASRSCAPRSERSWRARSSCREHVRRARSLSLRRGTCHEQHRPLCHARRRVFSAPAALSRRAPCVAGGAA